jgi:SecD/SecF fusion protein
MLFLSLTFFFFLSGPLACDRLSPGKGMEVIVEVDLSRTQDAQLREKVMARTQEVLENRLEQFGLIKSGLSRLFFWTPGATIAPRGADQILVRITGAVKDPQRAISLISYPGRLEFKLLDNTSQFNLDTLIDQALKDGKLKAGEERNREALNLALADKIPQDNEIYLEKRFSRETDRTEYIPVLVKKKVMLNDDAVKGASVRTGQSAESYILVDFTPRGTQEFARITGDNLKKRLAIILDGEMRSAPVIQEPIRGGRAQITGNFTGEEAQDLALVLRTGSLPAPVKVVSVRQTGQ